ncbi:MAG: electron transport complex subunit RsxC [Sulfuriferula sp.]|nr:electron transport complex subunit RsxC [Sulfuriferula sp.]
MSRTLYQFNGGVHPVEHKDVSTQLAIAIAPIPQMLIVPVRQHIGQPSKPCVSVGQRVLKGQIIAHAENYISIATHAPTSGIVSAIALHALPHPSGLSDTCITIASDGKDEWTERTPIDYRNLNASALRNRLRDMGIAGLGGAVFPSFIKLNPGVPQKVQTLLLNGGECEPWISCDDMTMRERAAGILSGAEIMRFMLRAETVVVGIEDNKPAAIAAMQLAATQCHFPVEIVVIPTLYPSGGAKQMIKVITGKEVPSGGRSTDVGVATFNVGTAYAIDRAIHHGEPMISRVLTVTGNVHQPRNFEVLIGTPMQNVINLTQGHPDSVSGYIMGGPMMGIDLHSVDVPVVKATNCILVKSDKLFPPPPLAMPCIRCTRCADACPADLQPQELYWFAKSNNFDKAQKYQLFDCIECGCCSYVCPSHIPLVQYYRYAKSEIAATQNEQKSADHARDRHETRLARIEREKKERAEKLAQKAVAKPATTTADDAATLAKKAAIQAAIARAATSTTEPS